jgi:hypothetical protein
MRILFILFSSCLFASQSFAAQETSQIIQAKLYDILSIEQVYTNGTGYPQNSELTTESVNSKSYVTPNKILYKLDPITVQIHTNVGTPIVVQANFTELKNSSYSFSPSALSVSPKSYTINNPYDHVISEQFTPNIDVTSTALPGTYTGKIIFTLGTP